MSKTLTKLHISGQIAAIASKSAAHRLMICAALADEPTELHYTTTNKDMEATRACLAAMNNGGVLPCGESGSTLRFLLPVAAALGLDVTFRMEGRLPQRPLAPLDAQLTAHGVTLSRPGPDLLRVQGRLTPGDYVLPGNVSSQFISGLLFALPLLDGPSTLTVTGPIESAPYIDMTLDALEKFGVRFATAPSEPRNDNQIWDVIAKDGRAGACSRRCGDPSPLVFFIDSQNYRSPGPVTVEGDWSNAAFWLCAGALSGPVTVTGLDPDSLQGDKEILNILRRFGANMTENDGNFTVSPGNLQAIDIDASAIPDLVPVLSVVAAAAWGTTKIYNAQRLRLKESDRIATVAAMVNGLGGRAEETADGLLIHGGGLTGGTVDSVGDHRIAMSAAVAATLCPVTILGPQAVEKSYPQFWQDLTALTKGSP